ncbi:CBS domain-containing protein [Desulfurobacterium atlanticum]|uniref:tRNA nucleotidyltransferase (CCA-adding enzyme) n=1 Tax=Desulfurobacterium atlanticum TaxID=240169 RepID=A0A238Y710_9BACT|nr:CBS domain-containing protein [Desulfurobacterium atlanticum]SNR66742.1 tRNA nucleotidyltransferase (CCA-adding enzyme) [Desulfurobacterium atlanticum]
MAKIITTHKNMDLDALGAVIAAKKLYPEATVILPGTKGKDVIKVLQENPSLIEYVDETGFEKSEKIETVIVVDTPDINRIPQVVKKIIEAENCRVIIYDHHTKDVSGFENSELYFKETGAVTSLLTMILKSRKIIPSPLEASIMALGIYSDTGSFLFPGTTSLDLMACSYLFSIGANPETIKYYLPKELSPEEIDILKILKDNIEIKEINGNTVAITTAQFDRYVGDIAHLISKLLDINNYPALIAIISVEGTIFVICRSKTPLVDVSKVAEKLGGGGHKEAASAVIRDKTLYEAKELVLKLLKETVQPAKVARDIMSTPAQVLKETVSVKDALSFLMKQGINAAPVVDEDGNIVGLINRNLTDKAIHMGIESEPVFLIMERDFEYVTPETPVGVVEKIVIDNQQTLVPVIENGKVVGVITRTDILTNLYRNIIDESEKFYRKRTLSSPGYKNVKQIMKERLPEKVFNLLKKIGEIADREKINAYVIGGFVRDLIIGRRNLDVDIVVEGDAPSFAKKVAKELNGKLHSFEKFKTATVTLPDGFRIDFASARTEIYRAPGALPEVDTAPLKKDLFRRDFTINTLAIKINGKEFGKLIDFFNGLKDIKEKKIRVLHALSFVEDPTRILRALRFAVRYRFDLGKHTEKLLRIAVKKNLFRTVEGKRVYLELKHIFEEENPLRIVNRMKEYGILKSISSGIIWDKRKKDFFERIRKVINWHKLTFGNRKKVNYPIIYFAAFLEGIHGKELEKLLKDFSIPEKEVDLIKNLIYRGKQLLKTLEKEKLKNSEIYNLLKSEPDELTLYIAAKTDKEKLRLKLLDFLGEWKEMKLAITGRDLKETGLKPGPVFKKILKTLKDKVIDGEIDNVYDELKTEAQKQIETIHSKN